MTTVMTALGPVEAEELGVTLTHEHIFINLLPEYRETGLLNNYSLMVSEVRHFADLGGTTIVDVTPPELSSGAAPDPAGSVSGRAATGYPENGARSSANLLALQKLASEAPINVVVGTGHYRDPYLDVDWFDRRGIEMIAELLVRDIEQGMAGTGIRAGIIGEIGADKWFVSALEERSFRAAARAQRRTGLAITTHAARWPVGLAQLDIVQSEGVDPRRVIIGHCDSVNLPEYHEKIVARGAFVQFDTIRGRSTYDIRLRVELVMNLVKHGYVDQILLSHDVCTTSHLSSYGGGGYTVVGTIFREALLEAGLAPEEFDHISIDNPRRALTGGT